MNLASIISEIDLEISRLQQAKQLLSEDSSSPATKRGPGRPAASAKSATHTGLNAPKRRTMSAAGRARIAAAQKARWAKSKKAAKKAASAVPQKKVASKSKAVAKKTAGTKAESSTTTA